ncbi:hypothetical protein [Streptomyces sp. NPDC047706]|uniref:hypothetical protein n=1 Tax=Streptomyces sp. NPDC047706 TaxID=3365486 RepID=UPI003720ACCA
MWAVFLLLFLPLFALPLLVVLGASIATNRSSVLPSLRIPGGTTTARVRFRYTAGNNWYWVIDGVRITQS